MQPANRDVEDLVFRTLLKSPVPVAIFSWRAVETWPVEFVSPNVSHVLGYSAEDFLSGRVVYAQVVHPDDLARVTREVAEHSASGEAVFEHEDYRIIDPQGRVRWVRDLTAVVRNAEGNITHFFGYILDSTARHEALDAMALAKREAEAAARAKSEFLATVSHEFRTPLTLVLGPVEALLAGESGALPPKAAASLERVHRNAERLYVLVSDLLDFSKLEAGREEVAWESVDVGALIGALVEEARAVADARGIELTSDVAGASVPVPADRIKLERIALNLIGNALKFTPAGGRIGVTARSDDGGVLLEVADTGPGIPADQQQRVWERFEQADTSLARAHEGAGIGLALVKAFTELMGGTASVTSELGKGSRFSVRLPRRADELVPAARADWRERSMLRAQHSARLGTVEPLQQRPVTHDHRARVLVADDSADMRAFITEILESEYNVLPVSDGAEALATIRRELPDVIVCDVMMPRVDGLEVVRQLKADPELRAIPVILVTAKAGRDEVVGGLEAGADDYLPKPFDAPELRARVRAAERLRRNFLELARKHRELETAHQQLSQAQEQLIQAGKLAAVGALTAGISHELNNPLATILLYVQDLLRQVPAGSPLHTGLFAVERQAARCRATMRTLLDYARTQPLQRERVPVARIIDAVGTLARSQARSRDVLVEVPPPPPDLPDVEVCVQEVEAALLNLVSNALDVTPAGGRISVQAAGRVYQGQAGVDVAVEDNGGGIPRDVLPHIFEPFYTTKPTGSGTGLGLSLAERMVRSSGGHIDVDTDLGRGTKMRVWLPSLGAPPEPRVGAGSDSP